MTVGPDGLDPCDLLVRSDGVETFKHVLTTAADALDFAFVALLGHEGTPKVESARKVMDRIFGVMARSAAWQRWATT